MSKLRKAGYVLLFFYVVSLILIAMFFSKLNSIPDNIAEADQKVWQQQLVKLSQDENDLFAKYEIAIICAYSNKIEKASILYNEINTTDKEFGKKALKYYQKQMQQNPNDWRTLFKTAIAYVWAYEMDKKAEVKRIFDRIIRLAPDNGWMYSYYGVILAAGYDQYQEAIPYIKKAMDMEGETAVFYFLLSEAYSKTGDSQLAKEYKDKAINLKLKGK